MKRPDHNYSLIMIFYIVAQGEFLLVHNPVDVPFSPSLLPNITSSRQNRMLYLWVTDYVANSAGYIFQKAGILRHTITPNMVYTFSVFFYEINHELFD